MCILRTHWWKAELALPPFILLRWKEVVLIICCMHMHKPAHTVHTQGNFFCIRSHIDLQHSCSQVSALPVFLEMVSKWVYIAWTEAVPNNCFYLFIFAIVKASLKYYHFQAYPLLLSVLTCFSGSCILQNSGSGAFAYLGHVNTFFYCKTAWNTDSQKAL